MPRSLPRLAEEGRIRTEREYEEWALRVTAEAEDLRWTADEEAWKEHYRSKYPGNLSPDPALAESQMHGLYQKGISTIWGRMPEVNITPATRYSAAGTYYQYRDVTTGRFTSYSDVTERLMGLFEAGMW